jgi:tetratricopeptide (TPR) repeat protein
MQPTPCPTCGGELDPVTGRCAFCAPRVQSAAHDAFVLLDQSEPTPQTAAVPPQAATVTPEAATVPAMPSGSASVMPPEPAADPGGARELGLLLFEAEEALARGAAEKAVVLASRAVKERPDSLTARALQERARRELLRGRRRERLEERVREAEGLLEAGDMAGAEKIVTSALKLIPSHSVALALFARLKERRQQAPTAEAWAEQELDRLTRARARRSLETAQSEMAAGRERAAMMALRRGLRHAPDDPELLAMLRDIESGMERAKAGQRAVHAQVRAGLDLLAQGQVEDSLRVLRAVLQADPENVRAQAAVQQVRKAWLRRQAVAAAMPPVPTVAAAAPTAASARPSPPAAAAAPPSAPAVAPIASSGPTPAATRAAPAPSAPKAVPPSVTPPVPAPPPVSWDDVEAVARGRALAPARLAVGRPAPAPRPAAPRPAAPPAEEPVAEDTRSALARALPIVVVLGVAAVVAGGIAVSRRGSPGAASPGASTAAGSGPTAAHRETAPPASLVVGGPLATADPELRQAVENVLTTYARALESADAALLAPARPDLTAEERDRLIAPFVGAVNAATDLRVLDIKTRGDLATIVVLRTDVIVGGPSGAHDPTEETLHFWRRRGEWMLVR